MKFGTLTLLTTLTLVGVPAIPVRLDAQSASSEITIFDAPGAAAAAGSGFGTFPTNINDGGTITGHYTDANNVNHGFLRAPGGKFITFDAPGAGAAPGSGFGTFPTSISNGGVIAGHYTDAKNVNHGFLRTPGGELTTFEAPGAGAAAGSGSGTFPNNINDAGAITGHYTDSNNVKHGFLRDP